LATNRFILIAKVESMNINLIGRKAECTTLQEALLSNEAEMISVIGRRRVGKTFLVTSTYKKEIVFEITGIQNAARQLQLRNFRDVLTEYSQSNLSLEIPTDWLEAFQQLKQYLKPLLGSEKKVLFFDELPWLDTHKSGFLQAFGYFWNSWASRQNLVVVICGSAASWMIQKIVRDKGGLHNRITKRIHLKPFTLAETETYLKSRHIHFDRYQLLHLYMAMGGIPHYLKELKGGKSAAQNIDTICFSETGLLKNEFSNLFAALFKNADKHIAVIRSLAKKQLGLSRKEIIQNTKFTSGAGLSKILEELTQSGFISTYFPFGAKKNTNIYRLTDEYSLFYLQFMENKRNEMSGTWKHLSQTQAYKSWSGYAFESICLKHLPQIKKVLNIGGIYSLASTFYKKGTKSDKGVQIDLVLDRNDHVINLFEIKFYKEPMHLSKSYAMALREKMTIFRRATKTRKQLFWTLISTFGLKHNEHSLGLVNTVLEMDDLFEGE